MREEPKRRDNESNEHFNQRVDDWKQRCEQNYGKAEVIIAKQRHGPTGIVRLAFEGQFTKFGSEEHLKWQTEMEEAAGKAEVIIAKQRHGPTGTVSLSFQGEFTRFSDLAEEHHLPERFE
jgi:replicative DNA helicase